MKRLVPCLLALLLVALLAAPAYAEEPAEPDASPDIVTEDPAPEEPVEELPSMAETPVQSPVVADAKKDEEGVTVNVTIAQSETPAAVEETVEENSPPFEEDIPEEPPAVRVFSVLSPDAPEAAPSGAAPPVMADVVVSVLGEYQRRTYTVQQVDTDGNVIATSTEYVPGLAGLDYPWIAGAVFFTVFLLGIFKLLGGLMRS